MLEVAGLVVDRGHTRVLKGIDLEVAEGEIVALIGGNGAGKTTTLMALSGLLRAKAGTVQYQPEPGAEPIDLLRTRAEAIVKAGIAHCPEGRQIFGSLSVIENLRIGAYLRRDKTDLAHDLERIHALFPILGERGSLPAGKLSGGEQMMLALGRSLMARPRLMLLDEPSLGLAPQAVDQIYDTLTEINAAGTTILLVEQNASMALELADRAYVLETGQIALSGTGQALAGNEDVQRTYLGVA